jgi:hypothetical protein
MSPYLVKLIPNNDKISSFINTRSASLTYLRSLEIAELTKLDMPMVLQNKERNKKLNYIYYF